MRAIVRRSPMFLLGAVVSIGLAGCGSGYVARPSVELDGPATLSRNVSPSQSPVEWSNRRAPGNFVTRPEGQGWYQANPWETRPFGNAGAMSASLPWPAVLAVARVDDNSGALISIQPREAELPVDLARIQRQPGVEALVLLNPLVVGPGPQPREHIRQAAGDLGADVLLLYSIRTGPPREGVTIPGLGVASLGLIPNETYSRVTTASGVFVDVRSGKVLGVAEGTARATQLSNAYGSSAAEESARARSETRAFSQLSEELVQVWKGLASSKGGKQ
jgi:hypothetical protein